MAFQRTNIELDMESVEVIKRIYGFRTTKQAVNFALKQAAIVPMTRDEMLAMRGSDPSFEVPRDRPPRSV